MIQIFEKFVKRIGESLFKIIRKKGLGKTFFLWFSTLSLAPLLFASIVSFLISSGSLRDTATQQLSSISKLKQEYINSFFYDRIKGLQFISQLSYNIIYIDDINKNTLNKERPLKEYLEEIRYMGDSVNVGLDLDNFRRTYGYQEIYLIDLKGNIIFTTREFDLLGINFLTGKLSESLFARAYKKALESEDPVFSDIEYFNNETEKPVGFLMQKILMGVNRVPVGVMAIKMTMDQIDLIMQENSSGNKTGETYLVGEDLVMRTKSRFESRVLTSLKKSPNPGIYLYKDKTGTGPVSYQNYRNERVLGVKYNLESLNKLGVKWVLIAEVSESEAFLSAYSLRFIVFLIVIATIVIVSLISMIVARKIVEPILKLSAWAQQVAIGDLSYAEIPHQKNEIGQTVESFTKVVDSFQAMTVICEAIAFGDFTKTVDIRSEKDSLGKAVNQMRDNLVEVVYQANNISMGDYSAKVIPKSEKDMLGIALERMTRTLHDVAMVAEEVSVGDYSLDVEIKGDKDMLGKALNQMIDRLRESNADSKRKIDYLNNIPTPVHVVDMDFNIQFINKSGATLVGKTVDECIGKKCYALFNTTHCRSEKCRSYRAMNRNTVLTGDMVANLPDKNVPMRYTSAPLKDIYGNIIGAIEYMVDISDEMQVVGLAETISRGDYSVNIQKRSEEDRLSDALNRMTESLRDAVEQNRRQNWLKTGQTELNNRLRGELDIQILSQNIINFITSYLEAQMGIIYFSSDGEVLRMVGSYALGKEKVPLRKFKLGEGIVGQSVYQNKMIAINDIPSELIRIRTGFGTILPKQIVVYPFSYGGTAIGAIEIASINPITDIQHEFLTQSLENIGIAFNSSESRRKLTELLLKTQEQAEKLQQQQEELRQSNEELEGQTRALIASENNLQSQQEELRVINEELEERTRALEKQKADIQQKNLELLMARNEIEKKARDLEEVSKYKSEFLANMSHELRTPLNSILILSQLLSNNSEKNLSEKQVEFSKTIHSSGSDLLELINEILDLSKIEAGMMEIRVESINIEEITGSLSRVFQPVAANKGLQFIVDVDRENIPETIDTDSQRLLQVIKNLLSNAFKFTEKGSITLKIFRPDKSLNFVHSELLPERTIGFSVIDTGIGIPQDKQSIIFDAFRQADGTTSRKYGGTGLGLSISRELAWLLGGEVQMQSEMGVGSSFTLYLPDKLDKSGTRPSVERRRVSSNPKEPSEIVNTVSPPVNVPVVVKESEKPVMEAADDLFITPVSKKEPTHTESSVRDKVETSRAETHFSSKEIRDDRKFLKPEDKSILIIEDDSTFAEVLLNLAQAKGFKCLIAEDGETGLHFADFYKPSAIILDVKLPGIDGWQVLERLKSNPETRHIPVHFMSAAENTAEAMNRGAVGYLRKPISTETLETAFKKIERIIAKPVKKLLVIDSDEKQRTGIMKMIGSGDVATTAIASGGEALGMLKKGTFDCMILNPDLEDMNGFDLLEKIGEDNTLSQVPIIIFKENELNHQDQEVLKKYAQRIIIKNVYSMEALFAETTLFLHRVDSDLPESKQRVINRMLDKEAIMKGKKILIVDDDMRNVFALTSILEEKGMITIVGKNGKEGIEKLEIYPDIDLVLMDIMMPVMDGYEAMKTIRKMKRFERLPIIALTAKAMKGDRNKCVAAGANDYLAKPVDSGKLLSLLRVWLYD